jgi:vacuolar-type H+-ATPase subunit I/STV1
MKNAFLPITMAHEWRGFADFIAVTSYLLGVVPLAGMGLLELGFIGRGRDEMGRLKLHAQFVGLFLIIAHIAMIFGMVNPEVFGYTPMSVLMQM